MNAMIKTSVPGLSFVVVVAAFIGAAQARDDGRYSQSPLKPWFDSLKSARDRVARMLMVSLFQIRIGNRGTAITLSASITNGLTFLMMR